MAFELAPWLQPQNFMQAINQGSQFGLNVVQTNQKAWEMDQQRQQAMATLQQNWAEKVMANQTAQQDSASRDALAQQQLGYRQDLAGMNNTNAQARIQNATDALATKGDYQSQVLGLRQQLNDWKMAQPTRADANSQSNMIDRATHVAALRTLEGIPGRVIKGNLTQEEGDILSSNLNNTISAIRSRATNSNPTVSNPLVSTQPLNMGADPGNEARNPMSMRYLPGQGLNPSGDTGNTVMGAPAPQLAPPLPLTASPAGGTLPPIDQARNDALNALKNRTGANGDAVRARFKSLYGQDL